MDQVLAVNPIFSLQDATLPLSHFASCTKVRMMLNPDDKPLFSTTIAVRWSDMDAFQHVNNAAYLTYMEEARVQMLNHLGIDMNAKESGPVVINVQCTYLKPVVYPDRLKIECFAHSPGRSSFMTDYRIYSESLDHQLVCEGSAKVIWVDRVAGNSLQLPAMVHQIIDR